MSSLCFLQLMLGFSLFFLSSCFSYRGFFWVFYLVICSEPIEAEQVGWHMHKEMIGHVCAAATSEHNASAHLSNDSHESCSGVGAFWWSYRGVLKRSSFFFADVKFKNVVIKSRMHAGAAGGRVTPTAFTVCVHNRKEEGRGAFLIHCKKNHWWEFPCTWTCSDTPNSLLVYIQYVSLAYIQPQTQTVWPKTLTFTHATP